LVQVERLGIDIANHWQAKYLAKIREIHVGRRQDCLVWLDAASRIVVVPGSHVLRAREAGKSQQDEKLDGLYESDYATGMEIGL
jgi:hypothetical protein